VCSSAQSCRLMAPIDSLAAGVVVLALLRGDSDSAPVRATARGKLIRCRDTGSVPPRDHRWERPSPRGEHLQTGHCTLLALIHDTESDRADPDSFGPGALRAGTRKESGKTSLLNRATALPATPSIRPCC
jgi:hypothetical protein